MKFNLFKKADEDMPDYMGEDGGALERPLSEFPPAKKPAAKSVDKSIARNNKKVLDLVRVLEVAGKEKLARGTTMHVSASGDEINLTECDAGSIAENPKGPLSDAAKNAIDRWVPNGYSGWSDLFAKLNKEIDWLSAQGFVGGMPAWWQGLGKDDCNTVLELLHKIILPPAGSRLSPEGSGRVSQEDVEAVHWLLKDKPEIISYGPSFVISALKQKV
jgi:hypothetical protein